jgi:hypothetical protein
MAPSLLQIDSGENQPIGKEEENMYKPIQIKTTIPHLVSRLLLRRGLLLIPLVFTCLALSPALLAVSPPPVGGYPGFNTATGDFALFSNDNTQGQFNTAIGFNALRNNTTGDHNTAFGLNTLLFNTSGTGNMGIGGGCLRNNLVGNNNTAIGFQAMSANTASDNSAIGYQALFKNTTGNSNNAFGFQALFANTTGFFNNAHGTLALDSNTTGIFNNGFGDSALGNNVTGNNNTAIGDAAGLNVTGSGNVCIGAGVGGVAGENNITRIRNIGNTPQASGIFVTVDGVGGSKLGYQMLASSRRFKEDINPMDKASEALFALKPVNFRYKEEFDPDRSQRFGLIAEEVQRVNPDLVTHDGEGKVNTVRYEAVNAMLLNEFLKEHRRVEGLEVTMAQQKKDFEAAIAQQEKEIKSLTASLKEQAAQIQKVSARLDVSKPAPKVAANP